MQNLWYIFLLVLFACAGKATAQPPLSKQDSPSDKQIVNKERLDTLFATGVRYTLESQYDSARIYLEEALKIPGGREYGHGRLMVNLANTYGFQGRYVEALKYYLEAMEISEKIIADGKTKGDQIHANINIIRTAANLSEIYYLMGNQDQAFNYAELGNRKMCQLDKQSGIDRTNLYISPQIQYITGSIWLDRGVPDKAEEYLTETYEIAYRLANEYIQKNGDPAGLYMYCSYGKEGLARIFMVRKDYAKALEYAGEALDFAEKHKDPMVIAKALYVFSDIYQTQEQYAESGKYALKAMETYPEISTLNPGVMFNISIANLFADNKEKAYQYILAYSGQNKKNSNKQFRETLASMEMQFETEKKEMRIADLEQQKILFISIGAVCVLLAIAIGIILWLKTRNEEKNKQLIASNAILEWKEKEQKRFASELHDGVTGILTVIKFELNQLIKPVSNAEDLQYICDRLDESIETIRHIARGQTAPSLERYGMRAALEDYCLQIPNIDVDFQFFGEDKRISKELENTVYCCGCELVNNSFRHSGANNIYVQLIQDEGRLSLTVSDDGCGFEKKSVVQGSGLKNVCNRVAIYKGKFDIFTSPGEGTEINIELKI